jgi:prepilin-type N-terminal cleavage/methylation domain-containing protein
MAKSDNSLKDQRGFTILELMIATTVLSVILILVSVMMTSIGKLYQKGVNQSRVQGAVRTITNDVSQNLQLSESPQIATNDGKTAYCIGSDRYTAVIGRQLGTGQEADETPRAKPVLFHDKTPTDGCTTDNLDAVHGTELIPDKSRLLEFKIAEVFSGTYKIEVAIAYGDYDLLSSTSGIDAKCKALAGDQFCATADLTTTVSQRLAGGK